MAELANPSPSETAQLLLCCYHVCQPRKDQFNSHTAVATESSLHPPKRNSYTPTISITWCTTHPDLDNHEDTQYKSNTTHPGWCTESAETAPAQCSMPILHVQLEPLPARYMNSAGRPALTILSLRGHSIY